MPISLILARISHHGFRYGKPRLFLSVSSVKSVRTSGALPPIVLTVEFLWLRLAAVSSFAAIILLELHDTTQFQCAVMTCGRTMPKPTSPPDWELVLSELPAPTARLHTSPGHRPGYPCLKNTQALNGRPKISPDRSPMRGNAPCPTTNPHCSNKKSCSDPGQMSE
jgi:hypothetical protein